MANINETRPVDSRLDPQAWGNAIVSRDEIERGKPLNPHGLPHPKLERIPTWRQRVLGYLKEVSPGLAVVGAVWVGSRIVKSYQEANVHSTKRS